MSVNVANPPNSCSGTYVNIVISKQVLKVDVLVGATLVAWATQDSEERVEGEAR